MKGFLRSIIVVLTAFFITGSNTFGQAPSNDLQANAISVGVASYCNGISGTQFDLANATGSNGQIDVWYKFVANTTNFELNYPFSTSVKYEVTSSDGYAFANGKLFTVTAVGKTYYIRFYTTGITSLQQTFCLASSVTNDESYQSITIADGACVSNSQAFRNATKSSGTFSCYAATDYTDIWYTFTASSTAYTVTANTNTGLAFYAQVEDKNFNAVACSPGYVVNSIATATLNVTNLIPGDNYYVHVLKTNNNADYSMKVCATSQVAVPYMKIDAITKTYGDASFNVIATSSNTAAISYSIISGSDYASITSAGNVTIKGAGEVVIQAKQSASPNFLEGIITTKLTINKANLTVKADDKSKAYGTENPPLTITYTGLVNNDLVGIKFTTPVATTSVDGTTKPGSYSIGFPSQIQTSDYNFIYQTGVFKVDSLESTIEYLGSKTVRIGDVITLNVSSNNAASISFSITNLTGSAQISNGNKMSPTSKGTVTLEVYASKTSIYKEKHISIDITILPKLIVPTFQLPSYDVDVETAPFNAAVISNSPGKITYWIDPSDSELAEITSSGFLTIKKPGTLFVLYHQEASGDYAESSSNLYFKINIDKAFTNIDYTGLTDVYTENKIPLSITTNSDAQVTYKFSSYYGTISGDSLLLTRAGNATLTITLPETEKYLSQEIYQPITISQSTTPSIDYVSTYYYDYNTTLSKQISAQSNSTGAIHFIFPQNDVVDYDPTTSMIKFKSIGEVNFKIYQESAGKYGAMTLDSKIIINRGALTVKADYKYRNYNSENPPLTYKITGFADGEDISVLTSLPVLTTSATKSSDVGTYNITYTGGEAKNYYFLPNTQGYVIVNPIFATMSYSGSTTARVDSTISLKIISNSGTAFQYDVIYKNGATVEDEGSGYIWDGKISLKILSEGEIILSVHNSYSNNYKETSLQIPIKILPPLNPVISFADVTKKIDDAPFNVLATSMLEDPITYSILSGGDFATITPEGLVAILASGVVIIEASQVNGESGTRERALSTLTITKKNPALTYSGKTTSKKGEDVTLMSSSLSSGTISYSLASASTAALNGSELTINGDEDVEITITVAEDTDYMAQTITQTIHVQSVTTSINTKNQISELAKVSPNPFTDYLIIDLQQMDLNSGTISLCDMQGNQIAVIANDEVFLKQYSVDTQDIAAGMYILQIATGNEIKAWKLIK